MDAHRSDAASDGTVSWRELLAETEAVLHRAGIDQSPQQARWIVEEASGLEGAELVLGLDEPATTGTVAHLDDLVGRRCGGEPIQYVLGHWPFRHLDLLVDRRVLIPRPETEQVVEVALAELDAAVVAAGGARRATAVDLGTGSGAIALAIATERPGTEVWAVDVEPGPVAVARANLAGLGMAASRVRVVQGSWFEPLPPQLRGTVDLLVANPPYVSEAEVLPSSVSDWEPVAALVPGPSGLEAYRTILDEAAGWLAPRGVAVFEVGSTQADDVRSLATAAGLTDVEVGQDHAGLDRTVIARRGEP